MESIAISLFIRNEEDFLDEFFQYYIAMGFANFIIINDESSDDSIKIIDYYKNFVNIYVVPVNLIEVLADIKNPKPNTKYIFHAIKEDVMLKYCDVYSYDYVLIIDIDEFLHISNGLNLLEYLNFNKKKNNSVVLIPRIECGDPSNFYKNNLNLETLKYNYVFDNFHSLSVGKFFCDPINIEYHNGHVCKPLNNTNIVSEKRSYTFQEALSHDIAIDNVPYKNHSFNLVIYHLGTKNNYIWTKNFNKYRNCVGNSYRTRKISMQRLLKKFKYTNKDSFKLINHSKILFKRFYDKFGFLIIKNFLHQKDLNKIVSHLQHIISEKQIEEKLLLSGTSPLTKIPFTQIKKSKNKFSTKLFEIINILGLENIKVWIPLDNKEINTLKIIPKVCENKKENENFLTINLKTSGIIFMDPLLKYQVINKKSVRWVSYFYL